MIQGKLFQVSVCDDPKCKNVHFGIFGDHDRPHISDKTLIASVAFPVENINKLIENLKTAAYVAVTKE